MKEIKVLIKDKNTLVLLEDASSGDYINLSSLNTVDYSNIEEEIEKAKDVIYEKRLSILKEQLLKEKEIEVKKEQEINKSEIEKLKLLLQREKEDSLNNKDKEIIKLQEEISRLNTLMNLSIEKEILTTKEKYQEEINNLKQKIERNAFDNEKELLKREIEYNNKLQEKEDIINSLRRQKASLHTKQTGEDLEAWCDNEVKAYMQNGLFNCTWNKDNDAIKNEDETKASKADFIFKIYANNEHNENELLSSVCLEMKDENPDSVNKKTNESHYKQLDKNRNKKNCKYALLVSNLELDKPNDLPIYRVSEYKDMYVVRPAYMMTFLNLITSLTNRFVELININKESQIELKNINELMDEFDKIKNTYLDKPLEVLIKNIDNIKKNNDVVIKASKAIDDTIDAITKNYINMIESKISNFEVKINRAYKRLDK